MTTLYEISNFYKSGINLRSLLIISAFSLLAGLLCCYTYFVSHRKKNSGAGYMASLVVLCVICAVAVFSVSNSKMIIVCAACIATCTLMKLKEGNEHIYSIWSAAAGICIGEGQFIAAAFLSIIAFAVFLLFGLIERKEYSLIFIKGASDRELEAEGLVFRMFKNKAILKSKNSTVDDFELVYEIPSKTIDEMEKERLSITDSLRELGGIESIRVIPKSQIETDEE